MDFYPTISSFFMEYSCLSSLSAGITSRCQQALVYIAIISPAISTANLMNDYASDRALSTCLRATET